LPKFFFVQAAISSDAAGFMWLDTRKADAGISKVTLPPM
jgi:hypothetical protein